MKQVRTEVVTIEKLVHGGQGMGRLSDGRVVFVWNALPGEVVNAEIYKRKRDYAEAIAVEIIETSTERIEPKEPDSYLATSPWQMMDFTAENHHKTSIIKETFKRENINLPDFNFVSNGLMFGYRNKMEYSFYGDEQGLHLALHRRGSHHKMIVTGSALARAEVDEAGRSLVKLLNDKGVRAADLKSVIIRCTQEGAVVASLFVKPQVFSDTSEALSFLQGISVYHSNPKSPASVPTKLLQQIGTVQLTDHLLGRPFVYEANSFFQGNVTIFERTLNRIKESVDTETIVDMFCGVGVIGLSVGTKKVLLVESDASNIPMLGINARASGLHTEIIEAPAERATEHITPDARLIVDPPRAGLHSKLVEVICSVLPPRITYLSCNPVTQARDIGLLGKYYDVEIFEGYNFFPRTPHIETLAGLKRIA